MPAFQLATYRVVILVLAMMMKHAFPQTATLAKTWSVAPMMKHTNQYFRAFWRILSPETAQLFTEMITCDEVIQADSEGEAKLAKLLGYSRYESADSLVLQLGGRDPKHLAIACSIAANFNAHPYRRFNLNVGCPSNTVATLNQYGCALMLEPELTAECCRRMSEVYSPSPGCPPAEVSVKCRIGLDGLDSYEDLHRFISMVSAQGGVRYFQIHARKAIMGMSPMINRQLPPLRYDMVHQIACDFPALRIELNGGLTSAAACMEQLGASGASGGASGLSGVMVGRAVVNHPYSFSVMDALLGSFNGSPSRRPQPTRGAILREYTHFLQTLGAGKGPSPSKAKLPPSSVAQQLSPAFNLFLGEPGCERFQRKLGIMTKRGVTSPAYILTEAAKEISAEVLDSTSFRDPVELRSGLPWLDKRKKTTAPLKSNIV